LEFDETEGVGSLGSTPSSLLGDGEEASMTDNATIERVTRLVAPIVADLRLDLYDIEMRSGTLRITIDTPPGSPGGVDLEQISLVTRLVSRELDHDDPVPGHYTLEVSSPGLERGLRTPMHFAREVGATVAVRLREVVNGERRVTGTLVAADDVAITLRTDQGERVINHRQIDRAKTVFQWTPTPKPGKSKKKEEKDLSRREAQVPNGQRSDACGESQAAREAPATSRTEGAAEATRRPVPTTDTASPVPTIRTEAR
jgi:ribosome maturation factor RimP